MRVPASFESSLEPSLRHHRLRQAQEEEVPSLVNEAYDAIKKAGQFTAIYREAWRTETTVCLRQGGLSRHLETLETELAHLDKRIGEIEQATDTGVTAMRLEVFHPVAEGYRGSEFQARISTAIPGNA